ncbi:MAG: polysaccharide biosynthesis protein [Holosporaceae bacterium]|nr:polysaccharide biosynthesis protein [Holosporaceae bacterium]
MYFQKMREFLLAGYRKYHRNINLTKEQIHGFYDVSLLLLSYIVVSLLIYPDQNLKKFFTEIFSLLCIYGAISLWLAEKIPENSSGKFRFMLCATVCVAPVLFVNNTVSVSLTALLFIILIEFVMLEYIGGHRLFDNGIPAYIICENMHDLQQIIDFGGGHKILELIVLSEEFAPRNKNKKVSTLESLDDVRGWLSKINRLAFFPIPRRLLYFSKKINCNTLANLMALSAEFSIPLFKVVANASEKPCTVTVAPICLADFETVSVTAQEKSVLTTVFKNATVWICYDGRDVVLDIIYAVSFASSVNLTILCENEMLLADAEQKLKSLCPGKNYNLKITSLDMLCSCNSKPDILFYNMPVKLVSGSENNLKEAVIKNILETNKLIEFAHRTRLSHVVILSNLESLNASNWIGATQRIGELMAQFADSRSRKLHTKFRIIRIPNSATDRVGIFGQMIRSLESSGRIDLKSPDSALTKIYYRKDILPLAIKMIGHSMKEYDFSSSVYTLMPKDNVLLDDLVEIVCHLFCLRKETDVRIEYDESEPMSLEDFPNITEALEKTSMGSIVRTKFLCQNLASYETLPPSIEEINTMKTRDLIALVFQSLTEKIGKTFSETIKN